MQTLKKIIYSYSTVLLTLFICLYLHNLGYETWYKGLPSPSFGPSHSMLLRIWSALYIILATSFCIILLSNQKNHHKEANSLFLSQLLMQIIWLFVFFYLGLPGFGLIILTYSIYILFRLMEESKQVNKFAFILLFPYTAWIIFIIVWNIFFIKLNGFSVHFSFQ